MPSPARRAATAAAAAVALTTSAASAHEGEAPGTVVTTWARGEQVGTRAVIDAAEARGVAARLCSGAWTLDEGRALHVELPRPAAHAAATIESPDEDADDSDLFAGHSLLISGMQQDDAYSHVHEDFEVVYLDAEGEVVHRNATPPVRHFTLETAEGEGWGGVFVLTDHMEVDHLHGWLGYEHPALERLVPGARRLELVVEPVMESELTPGFCPPGEHEHIIYLDGAIGPRDFSHREDPEERHDHHDHDHDHDHGEEDADEEDAIAGADGPRDADDRDIVHSILDAAVGLLGGGSRLLPGLTAMASASAEAAHALEHSRKLRMLYEDGALEADDALTNDMVFAATSPGPAPSGRKVTTIVPIPPLATLARAAGCYQSTLNWEADNGMQKARGGGTVGAMLGATAGMNGMYTPSGIRHVAGKVVVSGSNYPGTVGGNLLVLFRNGAKVKGGGAAAFVLASGNKGGGAAGKAYVGSVCGGSAAAVVNGLATGLSKIAGHEVGHVFGSGHTSCGDFMGPTGGGGKTACSSTASKLAAGAQRGSCVKKSCSGGGGKQQPPPTKDTKPPPPPPKGGGNSGSSSKCAQCKGIACKKKWCGSSSGGSSNKKCSQCKGSKCKKKYCGGGGGGGSGGSNKKPGANAAKRCKNCRRKACRAKWC